MKSIKYIIRNTANDEPILSFDNEAEAVETAKGYNVKYNADMCYIVKVITTTSVETVTM
jgi:hypothetical protein